MYAEMFLSQLISVWFFVGNADDFGSQCVAKKAFGRWIDSIKYSQARWWLQPTVQVEQLWDKWVWNSARIEQKKPNAAHSDEYVPRQRSQTPIISWLEMKMRIKENSKLVFALRCKKKYVLGRSYLNRSILPCTWIFIHFVFFFFVQNISPKFRFKFTWVQKFAGYVIGCV